MDQAYWEPKLSRWSVGPGKTQQEKMDHAVSGITAAIKASPVFSGRNVEVIATGSYRNRTHIPVESDVDVAVVFTDIFMNDWSYADPRARTDASVREALMAEAGVSPASYDDDEYRQDVEDALVTRFGAAAVERGDICFDVHENTYRVESDCSAAFEYRQWERNAYTGKLYPVKGIRITNDVNREIINYPQQQYDNGEAKHRRTSDRFRKIVRIVKNLAVEMTDAGIAAAEPIPSFLIESLVYNVPDDHFGRVTFCSELRSVLAYLFNETGTDETCSDWVEVNELKWLFRGQKWTRQQAHDFISAAWDYVGLE